MNNPPRNRLKTWHLTKIYRCQVFIWKDDQQHTAFRSYKLKVRHHHRRLSVCAQLCLCEPIDCSSPSLCPWNFSRQEYWWIAFPTPGGVLPIQDQIHVSCVAYKDRWILHHCACMWEAHPRLEWLKSKTQQCQLLMNVWSSRDFHWSAAVGCKMVYTLEDSLTISYK